jgi:small conductance mechanosensitive channel
MSEVDLKNISEKLIELAFDKGPSIVLALITLALGWWGINLLTKFFKKAMTKSNSDISQLTHFFGKFINLALKILLLVSVASMLGVETTSFLTVLGAAGLAIGLALQGSLANFAGGILIIFFKPFKVGDYVETSGGTGTVSRIDLLHTVLNTPDNKVIIVPNGQLSNNSVTNYSMKEIRRLDFNIGVSYNANIKQAREIILQIFQEEQRVLKDPAPVVFLTSLDDSSVNLSTRVWVNTSDYWPVSFEYLEKIKAELDKNNIEIPFPQRDIHIKSK